MSSPYSSTDSSRQQGVVSGPVLVLLIILGLVAAGAWFQATSWESQAKQQSLDRTVSNFFSNLPEGESLDPLFSDADGDLLPDRAENADLALKPAELTFSFIASDDSVNGPETWQPLMDAISESTGLPVKYLKLETSKEQLAALRGGLLHITALSTGTVPTAVNSCGFAPVCTFGKEDGKSGYYMHVIVKADSPIKDLGDLRGKKVAFSRPRSNSGYKAPMVLLMQEHNLLPERDYSWTFTYGHIESIQAVESGEADAAPIASDVFAREVDKGTIKAEDFKVIHESEKFPPVAFGYAYNLSPEAQDAIRAAFLDFAWAGTPLESEFGGDGANRFVEVSYKDDWANIRRVDQAASAARQKAIGR